MNTAAPTPKSCVGRTLRIPCAPVLRNLSDDGRTIEATVVSARGSWSSIRGIELDAETSRGHRVTVSYRPRGGHAVSWLD